MTSTSLFYYNDQMAKVVPRVDVFQFNITGAKANSPLVPNSCTLTAYDAIAAQSTIDNFCGVANEFLKAAFDATAMGTDAFACLINMGGSDGQVKQLLGAKVRTYSGTGGGTVVERFVQPVATLTASSLTTQCALGAVVTAATAQSPAVTSSNIAIRAIVTGLDALTSGTIEVTIYWISK